jgi:hypothetical protein
MKTYVKVYFSTEGPLSVEIAEKVKKETGLSFIRGEKDIVFKWETEAEGIEMVKKLYHAFEGSKAYLSFYTEEEVAPPVHSLVQMPPASRKKGEDIEMNPTRE